MRMFLVIPRRQSEKGRIKDSTVADATYFSLYAQDRNGAWDWIWNFESLDGADAYAHKFNGSIKVDERVSE